MYLKWDKDYPHHATIISKIEDDMIFYAAHTEPRKEEKLSNFFKKDSQRTAYILKIK